MGKSKKNIDIESKGKKSPLRRIGNIISTALTVGVFLFVLGIAAFSVYNRIQEKSGYTMIFGYSFFIVSSPSMEYEIMTGEVIVVRQTDFEDLEIGQVLTFNQGNMRITHKIIAIDEGKRELTTHGVKNLEGINEIVPYDAAIGVVIFHSQFLGAALVFASSNYGFFLLIMLPLVIFVTVESVSLSKKLKKYKAEKETERNIAMKQLEDDKEALLKEIERLRMGAAKEPGDTEQPEAAEPQAEVVITEEQPTDTTGTEESSVETIITEEQPAETTITEEPPAETAISEEQSVESIINVEQFTETALTEDTSTVSEETVDQPKAPPKPKSRKKKKISEETEED